jgi:TonB family protein
MATQSRRRQSPRHLLPWSISLLIHAALLPFFLPMNQTQASKTHAPIANTAPLRLLSRQQAQQLLKTPSKPNKKLKSVRKPIQPAPSAPVVSLSRINEEVAQKTARYLATVNNRTARETRTRNSGLPSAKPAQRRKTRQRSTASKRKKTQRRSRSQSNAFISDTGRLTESEAPNETELTQAPGNELQQMASMDRILHQAAAHAPNRFIPNGTPEALDDVPVGDETILNTRAYKHGWFFNRVVGALYQNWRVQEAHRHNDPSGKVYGVRDRHTVVFAKLNRSGELVDIKISKSSGAPHLDDEAIAAFRRAQPFPNPPEELVNEKGHIEFPMGFNLRLGQPEFFRLR